MVLLVHMENPRPETKSPVFLIIFVLLLLAGVAFGWYKYSYMRDFWIYDSVSCDSSIENCFEEVGEDGATSTYKFVKMKSYAAPECDAWGGECEELSCSGISPTDCIEYQCSEENAAEFGVEALCTSKK